MKKCEHFKDLILTDYIDGELDKNSASLVESHLFECGDCRDFFKEVKKSTAIFSASSPANVLRLPVPVELWDAIKQNIEQENQAINPLEEFIDKIKGLLAYPKLVPVFASLMLMLLVGSVALNTIQLKQAQEKDQGEYLVSLLSSTGPSSSDSNDQGTAIEHYFL